MKTVAFIHGISPIGGAERELLIYLDRLPRLGYQPVVICPGSGPLADAVKSRGVKLYRGEFPAWRKLSSVFLRGASVRSLRRILHDCAPDIIHVNDAWWVPQTLRAAQGNKAPVIAHVRQEIEPAKVLKYELDRVSLVITMSKQIEASVRVAGISADRVTTLYSGVELGRAINPAEANAVRRQFDIPSEALLLGTVANLFPRKGYEPMLKALARLVPSRPLVHYVIVGSGDSGYERKIRALVQELGLQARVHFAGFQESVLPFLQAMDLYVQPSIMEGLGIAVVEAMAMGKPVVGTATGGLPEVIADGETGLLVPPGDDVALAEAIAALLNDAKRRDDLGRAGIVRAHRCFGIEAMMNGLTAAYRELSREELPSPSRGLP